MRRRIVAVFALLSLIAGLNLLVAPAASAHPYCGLVWGSLEKSARSPSTGMVVDVRAGRHACYDRLVLDIDDGVLTDWSVRYVDHVHGVGSGDVVPLRGGARLEVVARVNAVATDAIFLPNGELIDTTHFRTFRHVAWAGSFEAVTVIGLGVNARLPFRAFVLPGPGDGSRLVIDVAHRWCAVGHTSC